MLLREKGFNAVWTVEEILKKNMTRRCCVALKQEEVTREVASSVSIASRGRAGGYRNALGDVAARAFFWLVQRDDVDRVRFAEMEVGEK